MAISPEEDAEVITSDGKKIGKVKRIEKDGYFIVYKKGLLADEEIRIPVNAVLPKKDGSINNEPIRLSMSEDTLKHGYEYVQGEPNSKFMHGKRESEPKLTLEKQVVHFEPVEPVEEPEERGIASPHVTEQHQAIFKPGQESTSTNHYSCDMCPAKFDKPEELQKHRGESHKAPVNI
jgi:hypothetical protein